MTRLVKKPRLSLTTIGVLRSARATSNARASVASDVRSPTMISMRFILSTGEKKCSPMKSSGRVTPSASPVIGSVEVFDASSAPSAQHRLGLGVDLLLEVLALEHRLDHEVRAGEVARRRRSA